MELGSRPFASSRAGFLIHSPAGRLPLGGHILKLNPGLVSVLLRKTAPMWSRLPAPHTPFFLPQHFPVFRLPPSFLSGLTSPLLCELSTRSEGPPSSSPRSSCGSSITAPRTQLDSSGWLPSKVRMIPPSDDPIEQIGIQGFSSWSIFPILRCGLEKEPEQGRPLPPWAHIASETERRHL